MRPIRDAAQAKFSGLPMARFPYECACGQGTDSRLEFQEHLPICRAILDGVREKISGRLAAGEDAVVEPTRSVPQDAPGQLEIPGAPAPGMRKGRRR